MSYKYQKTDGSGKKTKYNPLALDYQQDDPYNKALGIGPSTFVKDEAAIRGTGPGATAAGREALKNDIRSYLEKKNTADKTKKKIDSKYNYYTPYDDKRPNYDPVHGYDPNKKKEKKKSERGGK